MRLRMAVLLASAGLVGCGQADGTAKTEASEETQAAYVLHGLLDQSMAFSGWMEQTATSPAVFKVHAEGDQTVATITVTKADKCKYQARIEEKGGSEDGAVIDLVKDFSNVDVGAAPLKKQHNTVASVPGLTGSCTVSAGKSQACDNIGADQTMLLFGFSADHEKDSIKAFKAKFCP